MKYFICLVATLFLVLSACSDVTGPEIEDPPPDTTETFTVTLYAEVNNYPNPKILHISYLHMEVGDQIEEWVTTDTLITEWETEFEAAQGDSIYLYVNGHDNPETVLVYCAIFVDDVWITSSGPPDLSGSCSYKIP